MPRHCRPSDDRSTFVRRAPAAHRALPVALLAVALLATACGDSEPPVGSVGLEPSEIRLPYPESAEVRLTWSMDADVEASQYRPLVFVHLLDEDGELLRTFDHRFPEAWRAGQELTYSIDIYQSMLGPPLAEGSYALTVGLYQGDRRWVLEGAEEVGRREYRIGTVVAPPPQPGELPTLEYADGWGTLTDGTDRQVLAWRPLDEAGAIRISGIPADGRLALRFEIDDMAEGFERVPQGAGTEDGAAGAGEAGDATAAGDAEGEDPEAAADAEAGDGEAGEATGAAPAPGGEGEWAPALHLATTCDGGEDTISGIGGGTVEVGLSAGEDCVIEVRANFSVRVADPQAADQRPPSLARLTRVSWSPQG